MKSEKEYFPSSDMYLFKEKRRIHHQKTAFQGRDTIHCRDQMNEELFTNCNASKSQLKMQKKKCKQVKKDEEDAVITAEIHFLGMIIFISNKK